MAVAYDATKLDETHVVWIQVTRQTDLVFQHQREHVLRGQPSPTTSSRVAPARRWRARSSSQAKLRQLPRQVQGRDHVVGRVPRRRPRRRPACATSATTRVAPRTRWRTRRASSTASTTARTSRRPTCSTASRRPTRRTSATATPATRARRRAPRRRPTRRTLACRAATTTSSSPAPPPSRPARSSGDLVRGTDGKPVPCNHVGGAVADTTCADLPRSGPRIRDRELPQAGRAAGSRTTLAGATAGRTPTPTPRTSPRAASCRPGADVITYDVKSVDAVVDATSRRRQAPADHVQAQGNGTDVVFQTFAPTATPPVTELMPNFVGSPSVVLRVRGAAGRHHGAGRLQRIGERLHQEHLERHRDRHRRRHAHRPRRDRLLHDQAHRRAGPRDRDDAHRRRRLHLLAVEHAAAGPDQRARLPVHPERSRQRQGAGRPQRPGAERLEGRHRLHRPPPDRRQREVQELPRRARRRADVPRRSAQRRPDLLVLPQPEPHQLRLGGWLEVLHPRDPRAVASGR